jgi:hypothetical protein
MHENDSSTSLWLISSHKGYKTINDLPSGKQPANSDSIQYRQLSCQETKNVIIFECVAMKRDAN